MAFNKALYDVCRVVLPLIARFLWGLKVYGLENIPEKSGFMLAPNHASYLDPPLIGAALNKRYVKYMAKHTLFKNKLFAWLITSLGAFPVRRNARDRESWNTFCKLIKDGYAVICFPEGTRTETGELQQARRGTGMLIYKAKAMVVPVYLDTYKVWPKHRKFPSIKQNISVIFGKPISFNEEFLKEESLAIYEIIAKKVMSAIGDLKEQLSELK